MKKLKSFVRKEKSNPTINVIDFEDPVFSKKVTEITRAFLDKNPLLTKYRIELSKEFKDEVQRQWHIYSNSLRQQRTRSEVDFTQDRSPGVLPPGTLERKLSVKSSWLGSSLVNESFKPTSTDIEELILLYCKKYKKEFSKEKTEFNLWAATTAIFQTEQQYAERNNDYSGYELELIRGIKRLHEDKYPNWEEIKHKEKYIHKVLRAEKRTLSLFRYREIKNLNDPDFEDKSILEITLDTSLPSTPSNPTRKEFDWGSVGTASLGAQQSEEGLDSIKNPIGINPNTTGKNQENLEDEVFIHPRESEGYGTKTSFESFITNFKGSQQSLFHTSGGGENLINLDESSYQEAANTTLEDSDDEVDERNLISEFDLNRETISLWGRLVFFIQRICWSKDHRFYKRNKKNFKFDKRRSG